jgi:mannitol-1-phosphate 5-dehydrogenase
MTKRILIFGAGKIGRGFIGHLFHRSGYALTFVDPVEAVVAGLNQRASYPVHVLGAPEKNETVPIAKAIASSAEHEVIEAIRRHDLFATAVGGTNLESLGRLLGKGLQARFDGGNRSDANVIICENYKDPASLLRKAILDTATQEAFRDWVKSHLGLVETQVLRSCIEPNAELKAGNPLALRVQDWWVLPCDADAFRGGVPECEGLSPRTNFQHELIRKLYTYNCSNAAIAYLGYLKGYKLLSEAANDAEILEVVDRIYEESGAALIAEYRFDLKEQQHLQKLAITKYQDKRIVDPIERNARDTRRKLSPTDRLLGPATLAIKHGVSPKHLALAIAAAFHYDGSTDAGTQHVQQVLRTRGLKAAICEISDLAPDSTMAKLIQQSVQELEKFNKIGRRLMTK